MLQPSHSNTSLANLLASIGALFVTYLVCSSLIVPDLVNKSLVEGNSLSSGRYGITFPAIESIGELESDAVVTIGSSILQYATDGACISEKLTTENTRVYNLAISGANPYTEMVQIPALAEMKPRMVLLDLGPNSLWDFYESESLDDYIEFRFTVLSITAELHAEGEWSDLLRERDRKYIANSVYERMQLTSSHSQSAFDELFLKYFHDVLDIPYYNRGMPEIGSDAWLSYLETPNFMPPKFETWNDSEVDNWFQENMSKKAKLGVYNPNPNGTLNHQALNFMIQTLTEAGIEVVLVAPPHHPQVYDYLQPGQIDGHNATLKFFEQTYGVQSLNWYWETWEPGMFRDSNHLGDLGREYYCERMAVELNHLLEG